MGRWVGYIFSGDWVEHSVDIYYVHLVHDAIMFLWPVFVQMTRYLKKGGIEIPYCFSHGSLKKQNWWNHRVGREAGQAQREIRVPYRPFPGSPIMAVSRWKGQESGSCSVLKTECLSSWWSPREFLESCWPPVCAGIPKKVGSPASTWKPEHSQMNLLVRARASGLKADTSFFHIPLCSLLPKGVAQV